MTSAFAAGEARWLREPPGMCDRCWEPVYDDEPLCWRCEDDQYDHDQNEADEREERAAARGRDCL